MDNFAWSTVSVVFLLLPGFLFFTGLRFTERFSRAEIQQGPVAQLVTAILVASVVHLVLLGLVGWKCADWSPLACVDYDLLLRGPGATQRQLSVIVASSLAPVAGYFLAANGAGVVLGWLWGHFLTRRGRRLAQHVWVYDLDSRKAGDRKLRRRANYAYYANVLTRIGDSSSKVVYRGDVVDLGIGPNGCINYLVLGNPSRNVFRRDPVSIDADKWHVIGEETESSESEMADVDLTGAEADVNRREAPAKGRRQDQMLYVAGDSIENVVFSQYALPPVDDEIRKQLRFILDAPPGDVTDLAQYFETFARTELEDDLE